MSISFDEHMELSRERLLVRFRKAQNQSTIKGFYDLVWQNAVVFYISYLTIVYGNASMLVVLAVFLTAAALFHGCYFIDFMLLFSDKRKATSFASEIIDLAFLWLFVSYGHWYLASTVVFMFMADLRATIRYHRFFANVSYKQKPILLGKLHADFVNRNLSKDRG